MYNNDGLIYTSPSFQITKYREPQAGDITNPSGDVTGQVDLSQTNQKLDDINTSLTNQTQAIISGDTLINNSINNQTQAIISGDALILGALTDTTPPPSGDITIDSIPTIEVEDVSQEFFSWLLVKVKEVLDFDGVSILSIPLMNQTYEVRSDVFRLPGGVLRTFIEAGWYFIIGVPFLKYIRHFIEKIKSGNVPGADEKDDLLGNVL